MRTFDRRDLLRAAVAGTTALALPSFARPAAASDARWAIPAPAIPDSAAGTQLRWALDQINSGAQSLTERELKRRFTADFLSALPAEALLGTFRAYLAPNGPMAVARFEGAVTETWAQAILITPGADWRVTLGIDQDGSERINQLYFEPVSLPAPLPKPISSWRPIARRLAAIAPFASFFAAELVDGELEPLYELSPDTGLSIASSFKLYVLGELARQIEAGTASWDEPLTVRDDLRSLPNGQMYLEPAGATYPIIHYAQAMIANSDNTATDHLIARLGRENVEAAFAAFGNTHAERNIPLLMTREWFAMKMRLSRKEIEGYLARDVAAKRAFIAERVEAEAITLSEVEPWPGAYFIDRIEWFASTSDLCRVMAALHEMAGRPGLSPIHDALSMNAGIAFDARTWAYVGYKGGYETGVKSDTWLLQRGDGRWFVISAIINDLQNEINGHGLSQLIMPAVGLLADRP